MSCIYGDISSTSACPREASSTKVRGLLLCCMEHAVERCYTGQQHLSPRMLVWWLTGTNQLDAKCPANPQQVPSYQLHIQKCMLRCRNLAGAFAYRCSWCCSETTLNAVYSSAPFSLSFSAPCFVWSRTLTFLLPFWWYVRCPFITWLR